MPALAKHPKFEGVSGPLCLLVLDGYGIYDEYEGNCAYLANPENINGAIAQAKQKQLYVQLKAHGPAVGLPDETDMGNSEVGHNALGAGQIIAQGAKMVNDSMQGKLFESKNWQTITAAAKEKTVHLFGLLSDGGVHSNITHLLTLLRKFAEAGCPNVRVHALTDGRDVAGDSSPKYIKMLEDALAQAEASGSGFSYRVGSGGGRMYVTMDRYNSDWNIVKRGYDSMVHGKIDESIVPEVGKNGYTGYYKSMSEWREAVGASFPDKSDQNYPPFVIVDADGNPTGKIGDGDIVINFNFRGDRAIEISRAFIEGDDFKDMDRGVAPKVDYYGMLIYDNDVGIPKQSLVPNPEIHNVMSEYLVASGVTMYAMSETHKYGHMTFFWNGNRSGYLDTSLEKYEEITSEPATPEQIAKNPAMKAPEIADAMIAAVESGKFKFLRANFANGDMAGHTGLIAETTQSVSIMDKQVGRVLEAVRAKGGTTIVVADHGNCEYMKDKKGGLVTSHSCNPVPFLIDDASGAAPFEIDTTAIAEPGLTNVAATVCNLLGYEAPEQYEKTLLAFK
mmetsp:Transcript_64667/g.173203  ORF Transcript_64667/g.173203 Transcript_64667/m.173203 type:complete len:562 (+) Transcript_64667:62-1747(+)